MGNLRRQHPHASPLVQFLFPARKVGKGKSSAEYFGKNATGCHKEGRALPFQEVAGGFSQLQISLWGLWERMGD
jgi:hypothetical protein